MQDHIVDHEKSRAFEIAAEPSPDGRVVRARHSLWVDDLVLGNNNRVRHRTHGSLGNYLTADDVLLVRWDDWPYDLFYLRNGVYISRELLPYTIGDLLISKDADSGVGEIELKAVVLDVPDGVGLVEVRPGTSDLSVFRSIFISREYLIPSLIEPIQSILDLGANTGLSSVFFSRRYRLARVIAVEPEVANYRLLCRNTSWHPNIVPVHAAAWPDDTEISLKTHDDNGNRLADWAFQTVSSDGGSGEQRVKAISIPTIMKRFGMTRIDLLKVDIEGAEVELFTIHSAAWLVHVKNIIIETHDRFRDGADLCVSRTLAPEFEELPMSGENRIFRRRAGL